MKILSPIFLTNRVFYLLGVVVATFALGYSWGFLVYVAWAQLALLFLACAGEIWLSYQMAAKLNAKRKVAPLFSLSDKNEVKIKLINENARLVNIRIIDELPIQFQMRDFELKETLKPNNSRWISYDLTPVIRGKFEFKDINILFLTPLKLVEFRKRISRPQSVKVYPSFLQMQKFEMMAFSSVRQDEGIRRMRRIGHGYEFSDIRQYVIGDDTRAINWRASSRSMELMVNNYEDEKSQRVYAVIDNSRAMRMPFGGMSLMDYAINTSLSILNIALKNQDHSGLITFSKEVETFVPARKRNNQLNMILDALYNQQNSSYEANFAKLYQHIGTQVRNRSLLFLYTNFLSINALQRVLPVLKRMNRDHLVVVIFFENTELEDFRQKPINNTLDMASKVMADKLTEELIQVIYELRNAGIQAIKTRPEDLTTNTVSKYLELKSRGLI